MLIGNFEKRRVHSALWKFWMGGGGFVRFTLNLKIWAHFKFPYIFLLFDCFKWALIDRIEKWRVHSELWQFQMGGV